MGAPYTASTSWPCRRGRRRGTRASAAGAAQLSSRGATSPNRLPKAHVMTI